MWVGLSKRVIFEEMIMSDTIDTLRKKADRLWRRLRDRNIHFDRSEKYNVLSFILGEGKWGNLCERYKQRPRPYTDYQPKADLLVKITSLSFEDAQSVIHALHWSTSHTPSFNTFPLVENGEVKIPTILYQSHLFLDSRKRKKGLLQKRVTVFDYYANTSKNLMLYSGEQLNTYDEDIFIALLFSHPRNKAIGAEFDFYQK